MTNILVTGGAGYIGSHTVHELIQAGYEVVVIDNLYSGFRWAVDPRAELVVADAGDFPAVCELLAERNIDAAIHFAGHIVVPESVADPLKYYANNTVNSQRLIQACRASGVDKFIFSSTSSVYGETANNPIPETAPPDPINPYAASKLMTEWMLRDTANSAVADGNSAFQYIALRYFNVAGAALDGNLGQATAQATHLIKVASETICGKRPKLQIFGTDYATPDGTCIRDYIHVVDLARAHVISLRYLLDDGTSTILNCGYGHGYSVREVIEVMRRLSRVDFPVEETGRRIGDPPILIADNEKIKQTLNWQPEYDDLNVICRSALDWEINLERHLKKVG